MARFQSARNSQEEQTLLERGTPASTRYAMKWTVKIFNEWRAAREIKEVNTGEVSLENDVCPIRPLKCL